MDTFCSVKGCDKVANFICSVDTSHKYCSEHSAMHNSEFPEHGESAVLDQHVSENTANSILQVVFLLDITGSMGSQIEGVKLMISEFCKVDRPSVDVHIWTYTETSNACYVSKSPINLKSEGLVNYAKSIKLACPPDFPEVTGASGGDGPENVVAGVASLLDSFNSSDNLLCFIITDDSPHHKCYGNSGEALAEREWLTKKEFENIDIFAILNEVLESLNVTFIPVLYGSSCNNVWYQQATIASEGVVLCPNNSDSVILASGLGALLDAFQKLSVYRDVQLAAQIDMEKLSKGFSLLLINEEEFEIFEEDPGESIKVTKVWPKTNGAKELEAQLLGLFATTCNRFSGKKASKRCRAVNSQHISSSIRVVVLSMLYAIDSKFQNKDKLHECVVVLQDFLEKSTDDKAKWEAKLLNQFISELESVKEKLSVVQVPAGEAIQPVKCVLTLESALEYLQGLSQDPVTESEISAWMEIVLQLCMCRLMFVNFPLDVFGKPDFADAWSASIRYIEQATVLSAFSALQIRELPACVYRDPVTRRENNTAIILAHPNDLQLSAIYKSLSAFPSLQGLIQSHLLSGGFKVFPSIVFGLQASTLWHFLRIQHDGVNFNDSEWEIVRCLAWSLTQSFQTPASDIVSSISNNKGLNPVDNFPKIMAAFISYFSKHQVTQEKATLIFRLLFEEMSGDSVNFNLRKRAKNEENKEKKEEKFDPDHLPTDKEIADCIISTANIDEFDPCSGLHECEKIIKGTEKMPADYFDKLTKIARNSKAFKTTESVFYVFCDLLQCDLTQSKVALAFDSYPGVPYRYSSLINSSELSEIYLESILLKKRTGRYLLDDTTKEWKRESLDRVKPEALEKYTLELVKDYFTPQIGIWTAKRKAYAYKQIILSVANLEGSSFEDFNTQLAEIKFTVADMTIKLSRMEVLECLNTIQTDHPNYQDRLRNLGMALIIGNWTPAPACQLRRSVQLILKIFEAFSDLKEIIQKEILKEPVCCRPAEKPNRHGHTVDNIYPGLLNWSQEYEDKIMKIKKNKSIHLVRMKEFTLYYKELLEVISTGAYEDGRDTLMRYIIETNKEASYLNKIKELIEKIKGIDIEKIGKDRWAPLAEETNKRIVKRVHPMKEILNLLTLVAKLT
ncbi:hypothetical protein SteCoe_21643 [Stentor coeruleus]|uniref:VWFA domain-containing protein n=1 Tax=Stentor coeruleus TaxID=5963 RepID=A0A1R2BP71_9CILI|nr:hypothetical protein SteCoe_21643 [Stentor coeruleus]